MTQKLANAFSSEAPVPSPVSGAVVLCGLLASGSAALLCSASISFFYDGNPLSPFQFTRLIAAAVFLGGLFGGFFVASLASERKMKHCLVTSMLAALLQVSWAEIEGRLRENAMSYEEYRRNPNMITLLVLTIPPACLISIIIGGLSERILASIAKSIEIDRRWVYTTRTGQQISVYGPRQHTIVALVWRAIAAALFLMWWTPFLIHDSIGNQLPTSLGLLLLAFVCLRLARQRSTPGARETLEHKQCPPIIYLRSFRLDGRRIRENLFYEAIFGAAVLLTAKTTEEQVSRAMRKRGNFLAIGKPGEELPEMGAARLYVGDDDWQTVVADLLHQPAAVAFVQAGDTQGLRWELQRIGETLRLDQVMLFVPFGLWDLPVEREDRYRKFRSWAQTYLRATLPEHIGHSCFIYFTADSDWRAHPLTKDQNVPEGHPLFDILVALRRDGSLWPRRDFSSRRFLFALFIILLLLVVFLLWMTR